MACNIFISTSSSRALIKWVDNLKKSIVEQCGLDADRIYWYPDHVAQVIQEAVPANVGDASILLCLVTPEYLTSAWCVREHAEFWSNPALWEYAIPVLTPAIQDWPQTDGERKAFVDTNLARISAAIDKKFLARSDLKKHAKKWLAWLMDTAFVDLRDDYTLEGDETQRLLKRLKHDISAAQKARVDVLNDPARTALHRAAYLSAYALAADRYCQGGWGFSTAEDFSYDEDGDELMRGRYDLNVVILRGLTAFLDSEAVHAEWKSALEEALPERKRRVNDRLPAIAKYLACLEGATATVFRDVLVNKADNIVAELKADPPNGRWGLDTMIADKDPGHHLVLHEFVYRFGNFADNKSNHHVLKDYKLDTETIDKKVRELEEFITPWLSSNNIFRDCVHLPGKFGPFSEGRELPARKTRILRLVLWSLLAGSEGGRSLLMRELFWNSTRAWNRRDFGPFLAGIEAAVDKAIENPSSSPDALLYALVCTYVLHEIANDADAAPLFKELLSKLRSIITKALLSPTEAMLLLQLNSLGWAVTILLADDVLEEDDDDCGLDLAKMKELWSRGRSLREKRVETITNAPVTDLKGGELQRVVRDQIDQLIDDVDIAARLLGDGSSSKAAIQALKDAIQNSHFWGGVPSPDDTERAEASTCVSGVLHVQSPSGKIDIENEGYNRLFLYPFSKLTNMKVYDLKSIRREFGEEDRTLVEKMGAVVVDECFQRIGDRFVSCAHEDGFKTRTEFITEKLSGRRWPRYLGFDDVLRLRTGNEENPFRWVHRTALIQPEYESRSPAESSEGTHGGGRTIAWYFVEIPDRMSELIENGEGSVVELDRHRERSSLPRSSAG
jgi:hypothetical protein